ncbi:hypothetical protein [Paenibacillus harenae]|uniref:Uncharacterized protein n=1 Tax=Paenibacillus harenae TaxID=306543 RepID=A0ABT9U2K9_PAEHA|nr:hypothetical protein [Paenibacillus harenae]MDQ0113866.1 hypothetical protein [Paenibacillus harenae]
MSTKGIKMKKAALMLEGESSGCKFCLKLDSVSDDTVDPFTFMIHMADGTTETKTNADFGIMPYIHLLPGEYVELTSKGDKTIVSKVDANLVKVERVEH